MTIHKVHGKAVVRKAERDIPCMKIVEFETCGYEKKCYTPYMCMEVGDEILRGEKLMVPAPLRRGDPEIEDIAGNLAAVYANHIHTYAYTPTSDEAIYNEISFLLSESDDTVCRTSVAVYRCVIPEGTEYIEGTNNGFGGYCSKAIRFERKLEEFTTDTPLRDIWKKMPEFRERGGTAQKTEV